MADEGGRFLLLRVRILDVTYILLNIYAPNDPNSNFFSDLTNLLTQRGDTNTILGGDFNTTLSPLLDKSSHQHRPSQTSRDLLHLIDKLSLCDPWRVKNIDAKEYTYYSAAHDSFTRIDYFLLSLPLMDKFI